MAYAYIWFLMTLGAQGQVSYSPQLMDESTCKRLHAELQELDARAAKLSKCVILKIPVSL